MTVTTPLPGTAISKLPTATTLTGSELVPIVQNGQTVSVTTGNFSNTVAAEAAAAAAEAAAAAAEGALASIQQDYFDIRNYGTIVPGSGITAAPGGDITTALQNTINHIMALDTGATGGRIRIPFCGDQKKVYSLGALTWPNPGIGVGGSAFYENGWLLEVNNPVGLTAPLYVPNTTVIRGVTPNDNGIIGNAAGSTIFDLSSYLNGIPLSPGVIVINGNGTGQSNSTLEWLQIGGFVLVQGTSCVAIRHCAMNQLQIDCTFWVDLEDILLDTVFPSSPPYSLMLTTSLVGGTSTGLLRIKGLRIDNYGILIQPTHGPSGIGNVTIDTVAIENLTTLTSLFNFDSTNNAVYDIEIKNITLADSNDPVYLYKNTGPSTNDIRIDYNWIDNGVDPSSTQIYGLNTYVQVTGTGSIQFPTTPTYSEHYRIDYPDAIDAKLVTGPRGPNQIIGRPLPVPQDPSQWTNLTGDAVVTTGLPAPDGSNKAGQVHATNGRAIVYDAGGVTPSLGDWYIFGCWIQNPNPSFGPQQAVMAAGFGSTGPGWVLNEGPAGFIAIGGPAFGPSNWEGGMWVWTCSGYKVTAVGTGVLQIGINFRNINGAGTFTNNYFNPCAMYVPASQGLTDLDVKKAIRSYVGGWDSNALQGDVGVLGHQKFHLGGGTSTGVRMFASGASPSTGTGAVGDIAFNNVPSVGQPKGWVCTVAGSPGTWVSMGNL